MKASKTETKNKLKAVVRPNGSLVMQHTIPSMHDKGYPCHILNTNGTLGLTTGDLNYWAQEYGSVSVFEGESITICF